MQGDLTQWATGITLPWALFSLAMGVLIVVVIAVRLAKDFRERKREDAHEA